MVFPFALAVTSRAVKLRWPATAAAASYMAITLALMWVIQLFPATPKLGPIYQHVTHMVTLAFPLWLVVPAVAIDLVRRRFEHRVGMIPLSLLVAAAFMAAFVAVQWPFATFLVESPAARNWFFNADNYVYWASPTYVAMTHRFPAPNGAGLAVEFGMSYLYAAVSSLLGLAWGGWMTRVQR